MAITTTIATHYALRNILAFVLCLVFGLWGVLDYFVRIPNKMRNFQRAETCRLVQAALNPDADSKDRGKNRMSSLWQIGTELHKTALVTDEEDSTWRKADGDIREIKSQNNYENRISSLLEQAKTPDDKQWFSDLQVMWNVVKIPMPGTTISGKAVEAYEITERTLTAIGDVSEPAKFDHVFQWTFISCLPFVPWFLWVFLSTKRRVYRLDDDGTLHLQEGSWNAADIDDIDMSRWMAKSKAWVVHRDGTRVLLDDYKHKNLHLIIGEIASARYPDDWTDQAKKVEAEEEEEEVYEEDDEVIGDEAELDGDEDLEEEGEGDLEDVARDR